MAYHADKIVDLCLTVYVPPEFLNLYKRKVKLS